MTSRTDTHPSKVTRHVRLNGISGMSESELIFLINLVTWRNERALAKLIQSNVPHKRSLEIVKEFKFRIYTLWKVVKI